MLMFAMAAMQAGSALIKGRLAKEQAKNAQMIDSARVAASNARREGNNLVAGAEGSLSRYAQSVNNKRALEAASTNQAAAQRTLQRTRDAQSASTFAGRLAAAEELGAAAANAAFNGTVSGAGDMIAGTQALRSSIAEAAAIRNGQQQEFELVEQASGIMKQSIMGQDTRYVAETLDYGVDFEQIVNTASNPLMDILGSGAVQSAMGGIAGMGGSGAGADNVGYAPGNGAQ